MSDDRTGWRAVLFGRRRRTVEQFLYGASVVFLTLVLVATILGPGHLAAFHRFRYAQGLLAVLVLGVSAAHAYTNDGLIVGIGLAYVLLVGFVIGGYQQVATFGGRPPGPYLLAVLPLSFAIVLGGAGFGLGAAARRLTN